MTAITSVPVPRHPAAYSSPRLTDAFSSPIINNPLSFISSHHRPRINPSAASKHRQQHDCAPSCG